MLTDQAHAIRRFDPDIHGAETRAQGLTVIVEIFLNSVCGDKGGSGARHGEIFDFHASFKTLGQGPYFLDQGRAGHNGAVFIKAAKIPVQMLFPDGFVARCDRIEHRLRRRADFRFPSVLGGYRSDVEQRNNE